MPPLPFCVPGKLSTERASRGGCGEEREGGGGQGFRLETTRSGFRGGIVQVPPKKRIEGNNRAPRELVYSPIARYRFGIVSSVALLPLIRSSRRAERVRRAHGLRMSPSRRKKTSTLYPASQFRRSTQRPDCCGDVKGTSRILPSCEGEERRVLANELRKPERESREMDALEFFCEISSATRSTTTTTTTTPPLKFFSLLEVLPPSLNFAFQRITRSGTS